MTSLNLTTLLQHGTELWLAVGLIGSVLEAIGDWKKLPKLVALGQRLEAASIDLPKLIRGSRKTAAEREAEGRRPVIPPMPVLMLAFAAFALGGVLGCSSAQLPSVADKVGAASKLVLPMSRDALTMLQAERDRLVKEGLLTGDAATQVNAGLDAVDAVLKRVERREKVTRAALLKAIDTAALVNEVLVAVGGKPPPLVASAIDVARRVVGESE